MVGSPLQTMDDLVEDFSVSERAGSGDGWNRTVYCTSGYPILHDEREWNAGGYAVLSGTCCV